MPANFDRVARPYRWLEYLTLGSALQRCRTHFLARVSSRRDALVLGDGDGRFLAQLFAANPLLRATAVDTSAAMLTLLRKRCYRVSPSAQLITCHQDALTYTPSAATDLIVAHFFFDCFTQEELGTLIQRLTMRISLDALWLISDFRIPAGAMRVPSQILLRGLYGAFRVLTGLRVKQLPDHEAQLYAAGLHCVERSHSLAGLLTTELWQRTSSPAWTPIEIAETQP